MGQDTFLQDQLLQGVRILASVRCFFKQGGQVFDIAHRHDAHAAAAVIGLDDDKRLFFDAVLFVFFLYLGKQGIDPRC